MNHPNKQILDYMLFLLVLGIPIFFFPLPSFSYEQIPTKIIVRVVSKDAKVIGSNVGGALEQIKNVETGQILAQGKQEGGTGNTKQIMVQPRRMAPWILAIVIAPVFTSGERNGWRR